MTRSPSKPGFAARPAAPDDWVRDTDKSSKRDSGIAAYTARLTIDITPDLRGRIKIEAFRRGVTVADMLRALLGREFPDGNGADQ
ncbi:hypothetical protein [Rhodophyticola porphyridii]|uniref:hypothetical protein n=1 Tax=Rhodophyticola porphyridii TaxID=1852017 RepID=UPI0035CE908A